MKNLKEIGNFLKNANLIKEDTTNSSPGVQSEQEKLRDTLKKFYNDKLTLQAELEKEAEAHKNDTERLKTELSNLKKKFSEIAENIANQPLEPTQQQIGAINRLTDNINTINVKIKNKKNDLNELQLTNEILKKQSKEYQTKIDQLQEDIQISDRYQHDLINLKTKLSQLDDNLLDKNHSIKQREQTIQWNNHEINKLEQQINHLLAQKSKFSIAPCDSVSINQPFFDFKHLCLDIYNEINRSDRSESDVTDEILADFLISIPKKISQYESDNENLMLKSTKYRREFSRLQIIANRSNNESKSSSENIPNDLPPPGKLRETIEKLNNMNAKKDESIKQFESIIQRQSQAIEKVQSNPSKNTALALSMRTIFTQIKSSTRLSDRKELCLQGVRILDAMLNSS